MLRLCTVTRCAISVGIIGFLAGICRHCDSCTKRKGSPGRTHGACSHDSIVHGSHGGPASPPARARACTLRVEPTIAWDRTVDEERTALLIAAEVCADVDAPRAPCVGSSGSMSSPAGSRLAWSPWDRSTVLLRIASRSPAPCSTPSGTIEPRSSPTETPTFVFAEVGHRWRAATFAARLYPLTGERSWLSLGADLIQGTRRGRIVQELTLTTAGAAVDEAVRRPTPREREVRRGLLEGLRIARIAERLNISPHTAKHYTTAI
jgi:hypothetical protein